MNRIFEPFRYITVPDGTLVSAFLSATDSSQNGVPWGGLGDMSIAAGKVEAGVHSWIHVHPIVTQVTYVCAGKLAVRMKDKIDEEPYTLELKTGQAVLVRPGTLFQLRNDSNDRVEVLYIVSPSYVFEAGGEGKPPRYDDARLVAQTWEELAAASYDVPALEVNQTEARRLREASLRRLAKLRAC